MKISKKIITGSKMKVTILLADFAQSINGKLYIMGGGWSLINPMPTPFAIAIKVEVPWNESNKKHNLKVALLDSDYHTVNVPSPAGPSPFTIQLDFEVGRPPGLIYGTPLDTSFAFNIPPIPLTPETRYIWQVSIDDKSDDNWQATFSTRPSEKKQIPEK